MIKSVLLFCLFVCVFGESYTRSGINPLNTGKLEEYLKANRTVIAMWSNKECTTCDLEFFTMYKMIYSYQEYDDVIIAATNTGLDLELEEKYHIESETKSPQYRLFVKGRDLPFLNNMNKPTMEWIKDVTGYVPRKESVMSVNNHNYGLLKTKYSNRNVMTLFCKPSSTQCQKIIAGYLVAADVFRTTKNSLFAYVDCSVHSDLCKLNAVTTFPTFRITYANKEFAEEVPFTSERGENIIGFMNTVCGTRYLSNGHYDEDYGRITELDVLAHQFMNKDDETFRREILKKVSEMAKEHPEAARYFNLMKNIFKQGNVAIIQELSLVRQKLRDSAPGSKESKSFSARNNIAHQFEEISTWKTLVTANPWNMNYLIAKNHLLVLLTVEDVEDSEVNKKAASAFTDLAKKGARGVTIATLNAQKYMDYVYRFHLDTYPTVFFYVKGGDVMKPVVYHGIIDIYALYDFVDDQLDDFYARDL